MNGSELESDQDERNHIHSLPLETISLLRTSLVLPSLPSILTELIQNSIDAHSTTIHTSVSLDTWTIKCLDNGTGISRSDLFNIGKRYWTNKLDPDGNMDRVHTFGFRGEALASLAEVGVLEIVSRNGDEKTVNLVMRGGETVSQGFSRVQRSTQGTTVWARDIFYKFPVRRKTTTSRSSILATLRTTFTLLTLLHPTISFSLEDADDNNKSLVRVLPTQGGVVGRWKQLWGRAGVEEVWIVDREEDGYEEGEGKKMKLEGFISLSAVHSKASQFIFINSRPLSPSHSSLHKLLNTLFHSSSFAKFAKSTLSTSNANTERGGSIASMKSPKRITERYPVFCLGLRVDEGLVDVTLEPEKRVVGFKDEKRVLEFVEGIVKDFLRSQGFLSTPLPGPSPSKENATVVGSSKRPPSPLPPPVSGSKRQKKQVDATPVSIEGEGGEKDERPIKWRDPNTLETFWIDRRTGNSWKEKSGVAGTCGDCGGGRVDKSALKKRTTAGTGEEVEPPKWMVETLEKWENPIFANTAKTVPRLRSVSHATDNPLTLPYRSSKSFSSSNFDPNKNVSLSRSIENYFHNHVNVDSVEEGYRFDKTSLGGARVIAQVDRKFILILISPSSTLGGKRQTLVMVDQHAADERIRVERFLDEVCGVEVPKWTFEERVGIVVSKEEEILLRDYVDEFARWGIGVELGSEGVDKDDNDRSEMSSRTAPEGGADYQQVYLKFVPRIVSDRLRVEKQLQQELVRTFLVKLVEEKMGRKTGRKEWKDCPPVLVELINSKACRGAIMFNDELTIDQCESLVKRLSATKYPFQCAHGRPSITPLVNLAGENLDGRKNGGLDWRAWEERLGQREE